MKWTQMRWETKSKLALVALDPGRRRQRAGGRRGRPRRPIGDGRELGMPALDRGFEGFWGPLYRYGGFGDFERLLDAAAPAGRNRHSGAGQALEPHRDRRLRARPHAASRPARTASSASSAAPAAPAARMAIVHIAIFDAMNAIVGGYRGYSPASPRAPGASDRRRHRAGGARHAGRAVHVAGAHLRRGCSPTTSPRSGPRGQGGRHRSRSARRGRAILARRANDGSQHPEPAMDTDFIPATQPGKWRHGPDQPDPGRARRALGRGRAVRRCASASRFRVPPPPAMESAEYAAAFNEVKRLGGDGVHTLTERTPRADVHRHLLGLRRHAEPVRAAAPLQPDRGADRRADGIERDRARAAAGAGQRGDGRRRRSRSGSPSTSTRSGARSPASARPTPAPGRPVDGDGNPATDGDPDFSPLGAPASEPRRAELHAAVPGLSVGSRRLRRRAVPDAAPLLRDRPDPVHVRLRRVQRRHQGQRRASSGRCSRAASRRSRRPRRRTARAASTSASTGRSTRKTASSRAARSRTTSSASCSRRSRDGIWSRRLMIGSSRRRPAWDDQTVGAALRSAERREAAQAGLIFWFMRKRLFGSYWRFTWARRS